MAVCPGGHASVRADVCHVCGLPVGSDPAPSFHPGAADPAMPSSFPYSQATWSAVIGADRAYYEMVQEVTGPRGAAVGFPGYGPGRRFQLRGSQMRIGRRSASRGLAPEIDLSGPPADPGISRLHAVLIAVSAGSWAVLDPGSANGTLVNGAEIAVGDQVQLQDGDRINLGAWTAITVRRDDHPDDYRARR
jgi:pSer/pThr/pTyr-binding forkhead associated (FHA) protein